jgi:hypothetical protein
MTKQLLTLGLIAIAATTVRAGELKKDYFGATKPGAWAEYKIEASDGSKWTSTDQRQADDDGHVVVEESLKFTAGAGAGTESKNIYVFPQGFNLTRDWLSYAKFTEKMTMKYGATEMPVAATTLDAIKKAAKDFRGAVTFETTEQVDGHMCDRYAYIITIAGPAPSKETGQLWLDATAPFGIVKQVGKFAKTDAAAASSYELNLQETGQAQLTTAEAPAPAEKAPAAPAVVSLIEGYQAGRVGIEVTIEDGSSGKHLQLSFINKTEADLTVKIPAGALEIPASDPLGALKIVVPKAANLVVPAGAASDPVKVDQQPGRGAFEGKFVLSVYEGTLLYSGSVTKGPVPK